MNVGALPVDNGYATLGHLIEREQVVDAIRTGGRSLGLFSTAVAAVTALIEGARNAQDADGPKRTAGSPVAERHGFHDLHI
jgi:hypothetical protein